MARDVRLKKKSIFRFIKIYKQYFYKDKVLLLCLNFEPLIGVALKHKIVSSDKITSDDIKNN